MSNNLGREESAPGQLFVVEFGKSTNPADDTFEFQFFYPKKRLLQEDCNPLFKSTLA